MILNQAATNIQKVFKRFSEKDHLLTLINDKYKRDMRQPTLLLQSIYRQMKVSQLAKQEYFIMHLREKLIRAISKVQALIRRRLTQKRAKFCQLARVIMMRRDDAAVII